MKSVILTNQQIVDFAALAPKLRLGWCPPKLAHTTFRNIEILQREAKTLAKMQAPTPEYEGHRRRLREIGEKHAKKDAIGGPVIDPSTNQYVFDEDGEKAWAKAVRALYAEDKTVLDDHKERARLYDLTLREDVTLEFLTVAAGIMPDRVPDDITAEQYAIVAWAFEEEPVKKPAPKIAEVQAQSARRRAKTPTSA